MDHAGLPLKTVLEQLDLLGEEVVPVLRKEFAERAPADVPDAPDARLAGRRRGRAPGRRSGTSDGARRDEHAATGVVVVGGAEPAVVDPAAGRPAGRGDRRGAGATAAGRGRGARSVELRDLAVDIAHNMVTGFPGAAAARGDRRGRRGPTA